MNIAIIGGAGFIGSNLIKKLKNNKSYHLFSYDLKQPEEDIPYAIGDISNKDLLIKCLKDTDIIYLKAGMLGDPNCSRDYHYFDDYFQSNIIGVFNVLEACKTHGIKKIIFDSSVSIYGEEVQSKFAKENLFPKPRNLYGFSKVNAERLIKMYCNQHNINATILRYSRVRAPQSKDVIYHFLRALHSNETVKIYGNPLKEIEFVHINDVIDANILTLHMDTYFAQFNISSSDKISLLNLLHLCANITKKDFTYEIIPMQNDIEPTYTQMDISLAKQTLGFIPKKQLVEMIQETYELIRINR